MEAPFYVGQKVICIKEDWDGNVKPSFLPKKNCVYEVAKVGFCPCGFCGNPAIWLVEDKEEIAWRSTHFAPIEEQRERIRYVAVSETIREKAQETVIESATTN
jgi:hypothetical protein